MSLVQSAYDTLGSVTARASYDETLGLDKVPRARLRLVPLGFFSKSLTPQQRNWPTWDRELFAILQGIEHFSGIVTGATIVIATDH